jgi:acetolactate synthase-1/2/3 large subunit
MPAPSAHQLGSPPAFESHIPFFSLLPALRPHRFDDRVTGKLEAFATHARIVHIDVDPAEIHKNKHAHIPLCADVKPALRLLNRLLEQEPIDTGLYEAWRQDLDTKKVEFPMRYPERDDVIIPQHAVEVRSAVQARVE